MSTLELWPAASMNNLLGTSGCRRCCSSTKDHSWARSGLGNVLFTRRTRMPWSNNVDATGTGNCHQFAIPPVIEPQHPWKEGATPLHPTLSQGSGTVLNVYAAVHVLCSPSRVHRDSLPHARHPLGAKVRDQWPCCGTPGKCDQSLFLSLHEGRECSVLPGVPVTLSSRS